MPIFLTAAESIVSWDDLSPILSAITAQFSLTTVIAIIAALITATIGLTFMWWGARLAYKKIIKAAKGRFPGLG